MLTLKDFAPRLENQPPLKLPRYSCHCWPWHHAQMVGGHGQGSGHSLSDDPRVWPFTQKSGPILAQCCTSVSDAGTALSQCRASVRVNCSIHRVFHHTGWQAARQAPPRTSKLKSWCWVVQVYLPEQLQPMQSWPDTGSRPGQSPWRCTGEWPTLVRLQIISLDALLQKIAISADCCCYQISSFFSMDPYFILFLSDFKLLSTMKQNNCNKPDLVFLWKWGRNEDAMQKNNEKNNIEKDEEEEKYDEIRAKRTRKSTKKTRIIVLKSKYY